MTHMIMEEVWEEVLECPNCKKNKWKLVMSDKTYKYLGIKCINCEKYLPNKNFKGGKK